MDESASNNAHYQEILSKIRSSNVDFSENRTRSIRSALQKELISANDSDRLLELVRAVAIKMLVDLINENGKHFPISTRSRIKNFRTQGIIDANKLSLWGKRGRFISRRGRRRLEGLSWAPGKT